MIDLIASPSPADTRATQKAITDAFNELEVDMLLTKVEDRIRQKVADIRKQTLLVIAKKG